MNFSSIPEAQFALEAVRKASRIVRQIQMETDPAVLDKGDLSPVTLADFASQALIGRLLEAVFPDDPLVAEEDSAALQIPERASLLDQVVEHVSRHTPDSTPENICRWIDRGASMPAERFWTLDPIDGTKGFLRGDQYAVALALVMGGEIQIGVLGCPMLTLPGVPSEGSGVLVIAVRGQGTWAVSSGHPGQFQRLNVSTCSDPTRARLLRSFESGHTNMDQIDRLAEALGTMSKPLAIDSQAKYVLLAAGEGDLLLRLLSPSRPDYREKIWDQAAGTLILEEAGGRVTDLDGKPLDFTTGRTLSRNRGVLASNDLLHPAALRVLRATRS